MKDDQNSFGDLIRMLRKRRRPAVISGLSVFLGMTTIVMLLPAIYESTATLLIEQPEVQPEVIGGAGSREYVEQRLQRTRQQVMSADNVRSLIQKHGLFDVSEGEDIPEELITTFNENALVTPKVTGVIDPRTMREADLTYAFDVSFRSSDATIARDVTADLAELFVTSNVVRAEAEANRTITFLQGEADRLEEDLRMREERLAEFRRVNLGNLPENRDQNLFRSRDLERDIARVDDDMRSARARKELLQTQLQDTPRNRPLLDENGQRVISGAERLDAAQQELVAALARYSDNHPDVRRLRREIQTLSGDQGLEADGAGPTNPVYSQLLSQIESADYEIRQLGARRYELSTELSRVQNAVFRSPEYEKQYTDLVRDYELVKGQYEAMRQRQRAAEVGKKAAGADGIESYVLINPAMVPTAPIEPARGALMFLAAVLGLVALFGVATILESTDNSIRGGRDLESLPFPVLGRIPRIE